MTLMNECSYLGVSLGLFVVLAGAESGHERQNQYKQHGGHFNSWSHHQGLLTCALNVYIFWLVQLKLQ